MLSHTIHPARSTLRLHAVHVPNTVFQDLDPRAAIVHGPLSLFHI